MNRMQPLLVRVPSWWELPEPYKKRNSSQTNNSPSGPVLACQLVRSRAWCELVAQQYRDTRCGEINNTYSRGQPNTYVSERSSWAQEMAWYQITSWGSWCHRFAQVLIQSSRSVQEGRSKSKYGQRKQPGVEEPSLSVAVECCGGAVGMGQGKASGFYLFYMTPDALCASNLLLNFL